MDEMHPLLTVLGFLYPILLVFTVSFKKPKCETKGSTTPYGFRLPKAKRKHSGPKGNATTGPYPRRPLLGRKQTADLGPDSN